MIGQVGKDILGDYSDVKVVRNTGMNIWGFTDANTVTELAASWRSASYHFTLL